MKKASDNFSRRDFLKVNTLGGIGAALGLSGTFTASSSPIVTLKVSPRYHRWHVDPGVDWLEKNTGYAYLDWTIPLSQTALVLVDVWQRHYLKDTEERSEVLTPYNLRPSVNISRKNRMPFIHAPALPIATSHANWGKRVYQPELGKQRNKWPPTHFRGLPGPFQSYQGPIVPRELQRH